MRLDRLYATHHYSPPQHVYLLGEAETHDTHLVKVIRNTFFWLTVRYNLTPTSWHDFIHDCNRDIVTTVLDRQGRETFINLNMLEPNDNLECEEDVKKFYETLRSYLDDTCCQPVISETKPVVREINRARFIAISSVIAATFPSISMFWPRHPIAANDNDPQN